MAQAIPSLCSVSYTHLVYILTLPLKLTARCHIYVEKHISGCTTVSARIALSFKSDCLAGDVYKRQGLHDLVDKDGTNVATVLKMIERINEYPEDMKGQKIAIIGGGAVGLDAVSYTHLDVYKRQALLQVKACLSTVLQLSCLALIH